MYHGNRHPNEMRAAEVEAFLTYLATVRLVSSSTQNQALSAILFLYRDVVRLRVKDVELVRKEIVIRDGKSPECHTATSKAVALRMFWQHGNGSAPGYLSLGSGVGHLHYSPTLNCRSMARLKPDKTATTFPY